jgi:hypothetical protein
MACGLFQSALLALDGSIGNGWQYSQWMAVLAMDGSIGNGWQYWRWMAVLALDGVIRG